MNSQNTEPVLSQNPKNTAEPFRDFSAFRGSKKMVKPRNPRMEHENGRTDRHFIGPLIGEPGWPITGS